MDQTEWKRGGGNAQSVFGCWLSLAHASREDGGPDLNRPELGPCGKGMSQKPVARKVGTEWTADVPLNPLKDALPQLRKHDAGAVDADGRSLPSTSQVVE